MKKAILFLLIILTISINCFSQLLEKVINKEEAGRIISMLASDEMQGRRTFTPSIDKAADFLSLEFKNAGIQTLQPNNDFKQEFVMYSPIPKSVSANLDGKLLDVKNIIAVTTKPEININEKSGYEIKEIKEGANLLSEASNLVRSGKNYVVFVDTTHARNFSRLAGLKRMMFGMDNAVVFVLSNEKPSFFYISATHELTENILANVVGMIPGKSKKDEYVIFSSHYDHIGIGRPVDGDSIYNGANDDAAGTTAVVLLAKYFKQLANNERTIIFACFTAEEVGGYGSQYFSRQVAPSKVVAMFNIEMIGTESKWGTNSAFITGYEKTDMGSILEKNLDKTNFKFYPDPYPQQSLFYRSDNATLARLGVPAHTISTAKMENEPHYHKPSDEVGTLDMKNMAEIIKAIALSSGTIVSGKDTPSRVKVEDLR